MYKLTLKFIVLSALLAQPCLALFVKNEFGKKIILWTSQRVGAGDSPLYFSNSKNNLAYFHIEAGMTKDIGNDPIDALVVAVGIVYWSEVIRAVDGIYRYKDNEEGTALSDLDLKKYKEALTKIPHAVIRIIADPKQPTRPLAILPEKELKEFLLKEHQTKAKPLIQEAGQLLPQKVHMPECVADICAAYTSAEQ